jgi:hypothetical protein
MKHLALLIALFIVIVGIAVFVSPNLLTTIGRYVITPAGLYVVAAVRVGIGVVLMMVAPISRTPRTLRALGIFVIVAGLATPLFGVNRSLAILDWEAAQGDALRRCAAVAILAMGSWLAFTVASGRRTV